MQGARNGPRMDDDPVGLRHWVAGGPVGYKQAKEGVRQRPHNSPLGTGNHGTRGLGR